MNRVIQRFTLALILLGVSTTHAWGDLTDLTLTLGSTTVTAGGTGTIDINIVTNDSSMLSAFNIELLITPTHGTTSFLEFTTAQPDPTSNSNYVFSGGVSFAGNNMVPVFFPPTGTNYPNDTITGGDLYDPAPGSVLLSPAVGDPRSYLATVEFQAAPGATVGDAFQISVVTDPGQTYFDDAAGNPLSYSSDIGLVTVGPSVPEPSSLTLMAVSGLGGLLWRWRRGRR